MTAASFNFFLRADITLAAYTAGAKSTVTVSAVNKPLKDSASVATFWPVLDSVGEVSLQAGEFLPSVSVGSITLVNTIGSLGANRKFSDLLQRYTPVEQDVTVSVGVAANDTDAVAAWTQLAVVRCSAWEHAANGGTLTLSVSPFRVDEKVLTLEVARTVAGMENAPESALGRAVPLVLGSFHYVAPVRITADGGTAATYAAGTGLHGHLRLGAVYLFGACTKNYDDAWEPVNFVLLTGNTDYTNTGAYPVAGQYGLSTYGGNAFRLALTEAEVVTGIQLRGKGNGGPGRASTVLLTVTLLRVDGTTRAVVEEAAVGRVQLSHYDAANNAGAADFAVNVSFDRPVFLSRAEGRYDYYVAWAVTNGADGGTPTTRELSLNYTTAVTTAELRKGTGDNLNSYTDWRLGGTAAGLPLYKLHKVRMSAPALQAAGPTQTGLTYASFTLAQFAPDTGQANPPLDPLQLLVQVAGLETVAGGTPLDGAHTAADLLGYRWTGAAWADSGTWDTATLAGRYADLYAVGGGTNERARVLKAVYDQRVTFSQVLQDVCRGTASRVGVLPSGKLFLYPWGAAQAPAAEIPAADIVPLSWQQRDAATIVNRAVVTSGRSPRFASDTGSERIPDGYEFSADFSAATAPYLAQVTAESRALFGDRELGNGTLTAHGVGPAGVSRDAVVAEYYLTRFARPAVYATFVVPWHRYAFIRLFDTVLFQHPEFPSFHGADPEPPMPVVTDGGGTVAQVEPNQGHEWVRAEPYRGLVEGISYVLAMEHAPKTRLTVLVLLNSPWDPT